MGVSDKKIKISFHYGSFSCQACSLFFRRQAAKHSKDACVSVFGNCLVSEKERKNSCKHCRFKICLAKGMKIDLVDSKKRLENDANQESTSEGVENYEALEDDILDKKEITTVLETKEPYVLGYFITMAGEKPRWVDISGNSITTPLNLESNLQVFSNTE